MTTNTSTDRTFSRSTFVKGAGGVVVAIGAASLLEAKGSVAAVSEASVAAVNGGNPLGVGPLVIDPAQIDSWIAIGTDGTVTMKTGKVELGQGTVTATMQLVADELDVPMSSIRFVQSDTWYTPDQGTTAGSQSTGTENGPAGVRQAAAEARAALLAMAATRLGVPAGNLTVSDGVVSVVGSPGQSVSYASLIGGRLFNQAQTGKATPKPYTAYKVVGTSVPRFDIPDKVFGTFTYVQDVKVPGMLHARVVRPPTLDSTLVSVEGFPGGKPPNVVAVVQKQNYVAVVARTEWDAIVGAGTLKVNWQVAPLPAWATYNDDLVGTSPAQDVVIQDSQLRGSPVVAPGQNVDTVISATPASHLLTHTYKYPIQMHGSMGTSAATAIVDNQNQLATVWSSTQGIYALRQTIQQALGFPMQNIHCIYVEGSGCYGINKADDVALDAAVISQLVGKPIRVGYTRADEHKWENYGQAYTITITGALDTSGSKAKITAWKRDAWTSTRGNRPPPPANMASGILMGFPEQPLATGVTLTPSQDLNSVDGSNSAPAYIIPAARLTNHTVRRTFLSGPLRSPSRIQNTFANEVMIDELAHLAGEDPVNFRLDHLQDPRLIAVIQAAAQMSGWVYGPRGANVGSGRYRTGTGTSAVHYEGSLGYNAAVVKLTVDTKTGKVKVDHVWSAQDCGPAINPDGQKQQAEGCVMQGISRSLMEEVKWDANGVISRDWILYPVVRFLDMPKFDFQVISRTDQPAVGAGEVLITNMPAAISNAIFDATGTRMRQLPFTPDRVKAALAA
jgi:CO/xanthine dehydrogenase Mo-binding subunit